MSQSAKPGLHMSSVQVPATQAEAALAKLHARPQAPQVAVLVRRSDSQPLVGFMSQSAKPSRHGPSAQAPAVQDAAALVKAQVRPQVPQLSVVVVLVSQPLEGLMSQLAKPALQVPSAHVPAVQVAVALAKVHARSHMPQLDTVLRVSTSHPLAGLPSQSAKPSLHRVIAQAPIRQSPVALGNTHARPHIPQCVALAETSVSQPSVGSLLQSPNRAVHAATAHRPMVHAGDPLATTQALEQAPHAATLDCVLTHASLQQVSPVGHARVGLHPITHN
jgi:hypothetical protein